MKVAAASLLTALVFLEAVAAQRQGSRESKRVHDLDLEPPRTDELHFLDSVSQQHVRNGKTSSSKDSSTLTLPSRGLSSYFPDGQETATKRSSSKRTTSNGKSRYHSEHKDVPEAKPRPPLASPAVTAPKEKSEVASDAGIHCVKLNKKPVTSDDVYRGRFKREAMTCYKCEDLNNGGHYEKCNYGNDPSKKGFFVSHQKSYSSNDKPKFYKYGSERESPRESKPSYSYGRRGRDERLLPAASEGKGYNYGELSHSPSDHEYNYGKRDYGKSSYPSSRYGDFDYTPKSSEYSYSSSKVDPRNQYSHSNTEPTRSYSYKTHEEKDSKKPSDSYDGYDPKSSEYSYSSSKEEPSKTFSYEATDAPRSYSYYTSDYTPTSEQYSKPSEYSFSSRKIQPTQSYSYESTDKPISYSFSRNSKYPTEETSRSASSQQNKPVSSKYSASDSRESHLPTTENKKSHNRGHERYSPSEYSYSKSTTDPLKTYHVSSSYDSEKPTNKKTSEPVSRDRSYANNHEHSAPDPSYIAQPSEELKRALGEFHQKDRSNCKKIQKDKMTCWQCVDDSGAHQEECMYVANSEPKTHQAAYSDLKEHKQLPQRQKSNVRQQPADSQAEKTNLKHTTVFSYTRPRHSYPSTLATAGTRVSTRYTPYEEPEEEKYSRRRGEERGRGRPGGQRRRAPETKKESDAPPPTATPVEFKANGPEGAFSADTQEVFDPKIGFSLPRYMLARSVHEEEFDRAVASGR